MCRIYSFEELHYSVSCFVRYVRNRADIYELMAECSFLAFAISSSFICLRFPVLATPPVTLAATTSLRYPRAPTLVA